MASLGRSRRLQNLAPEEDSLGACFICQDEFHINQLPHLRKTDCCRVLMHSRCLEEMLNRSSICGNCRQDRTPQNTKTLPLDEEEPKIPCLESIYYYVNENVSKKLNILLRSKLFIMQPPSAEELLDDFLEEIGSFLEVQLDFFYAVSRSHLYDVY